MRVLFLTNIPTPYRIDFFNELGKFCSLTVLYERKTASDRDKSWSGNKALNYKEVYLKGKKIKADSAICLDVVNWLKNDNFDLFIMGGYSTPTGMLAIQIMKMRKIPFILNSDGGIIKLDNKIKYLIKKYFISSASWWLSTGKMTSDYLQYYGANKENIFIYSFSSLQNKDILKKPLSADEKNAIRKELNLEGKKIVLSVGQFIHRKGYDVLIEAWKTMHNDYQLLIIGSGEEEEKLYKQIMKNNLTNVRLIGFKNKEQLFKYYLASDMFVLPTREDIWGLVINEAMACGLPIVTTSKCIAGLELIKECNSGVIVPVEEHEQLSQSIKYILGSEAVNHQMAKRSLEKIKDYTVEKMAEEHFNIFNVILSKKSN